MCFSCDKKAMKLAQSLPANIKIMEEDEVFRLLSYVKALPTKHVEISRKYPLKNFLRDIAYAKMNKRLLFSAFVIAIFSLITPFRNYYIFFSVFLLLLAIIPSFIRLAIKHTK
jgi:magnesium-transporting ATPase (P-type)